MKPQNEFRINLEFAIIVSMTLLVLSFNFYNQNYDKIQNIVESVSYWIVVVIAVMILILAVIYNIRIYWKLFNSQRD
ncbi:hypothetical protein K9M79_06310 [Candidatus Woesearchaeota archaeon]|nr:hypothetical protein [Candidatus Woesearchaeota archaeon]